MNHRLLSEAALIARFLDKEVINRNFTFDFDRRIIGDDYGLGIDSLYLVDRTSGEKIKIWEYES